MDGVEYNNDVLNSDENCSCTENELANGDIKYPDYSYRNRVNFLYSEISGDRCKKYQCMLCSFETEYRNSMYTHFMRHTNERPFSCQNCEYSAREKSAVKRHMLYRCGKPTFTARGEHKCDLCGYSTFKKHCLQRHQRCHTGERPFSCDLCNYRSVQNGHLKTHKLTHSPREKLFCCEKCDRRYGTKSALTFHMKTKHSEA